MKIFITMLSVKIYDISKTRIINKDFKTRRGDYLFSIFAVRLFDFPSVPGLNRT